MGVYSHSILLTYWFNYMGDYKSRAPWWVFIAI